MTAANLREEMKLTRKEQLQAYQTGKKEEKHTLGEITSLYLSQSQWYNGSTLGAVVYCIGEAEKGEIEVVI